jgi:hypothetical protein
MFIRLLRPLQRGTGSEWMTEIMELRGSKTEAIDP